MTHGRSPLHAEELRGIDALRALAPEWRALCGRSASCTPFQHPEWLLPWWQHFGAGGGDLRALAIRRGADRQLVGFAPLYARHDRDGARRLALIGTGNTDYVDLLADPDHADAVVDATTDYIQDIGHCWDECDLHPLPPASPLRSVRAVDTWRVHHAALDVFPLLDLGRAALDDAVPRSFLSTLRHGRRRLARDGALVADRAEPARALDAFHDLCTLHDARWRARGEPGVLSDARTRRFHEDVVHGMAARGMLRLHVLRVDGHAIAAFYGFALGRSLYYYLGGFDPAYARESAGSLVILDALEYAVSHGQSRLDFLRGGERYKYRWGAVDHYGYRLTIARGPVSEARHIA
ncbi:MAG TPA: GNAT family N-acetyltransferase [Gemmatimonadaceae bacterium]|nr:GNAT family N-acetyltransferase [Gemmatimonadaceae bacterium]